jgi:DNA-binding transcriptional MocR family regulator
MLLKIDPGGPTPVFRQIQDQIARLVDEGSLRPGAHLPATRVLAGHLGVSRSTVYRTYQELWSRGYLEARPGSYSTVRARLRPPGPALGQAPSGFDWAAAAAPAARAAHVGSLRLGARRAAPAATDDVVDFASLAADGALCPVDELTRSMRRVLSRRGREVLGYGDPAGYRPLRETLARRLRVHGVAVTADEILITNGAQHGLDLAVQLLAGPRRVIAAESPTYAFALPLFRLRQLRVRGIPMRADGLDLDALERLLARRRPALLYTIPNFHNPTGITTGQAHREKLLALCESRRVPVVEDGFEEELKYFGKAVPPIKSMDRSGIVIYLGTLSKVVFSGLRIGWIAAPREAIERLLAIHRCGALSGNMLVQAAVDDFCSAGAYEPYLRRIHRVYRARMQALQAGLTEHLPARGVEWTRPAGGCTAWIRVKDRPASREGALLEAARREGVLVTPGSLFFADEPDGLCLRVSVSGADEGRIAEGCRRLGRALAGVVGG